eukprot:gnl/TRDRNA2_/TRDRNA2_175447_c7_seq11.p1 gnl/TRDRNA2_/TRDRNA2_175447_c7~~gnl/TRDRNA2_/TRDRNA2_175447_c7_seq11.p1  ORF type:complete len:378 (+),score=24.07 gnl/TRDRNA2_/TRDRNA2_175447_c7_seq11:38-1171(+)
MTCSIPITRQVHVVFNYAIFLSGMHIIEGLPLQDTDSSKMQWLSSETSLAQWHSNRESVNSFLGNKSSVPPEVQELEAEGLTLKKLQEAIVRSEMGAVVIRRAFTTPVDMSLAWIQQHSSSKSKQFTLKNNYMNPMLWDRKCGPSAAELNFTTRERKKKGVTIASYLSSTEPTDYHIFETPGKSCYKPNEELGWNFSHWKFLAAADHLERLALGKLGNKNQRLDISIRRALSVGVRPIFSVDRPLTGVAFHVHSATWLALTHGRKAWWLGPEHLAGTLKSLGSNATATSPCQYLKKRPHPKLKFILQDAGDIIVFGTDVSHATCSLETSVGIGKQVGFQAVPYLSLDRRVNTSCKNTECSRMKALGYLKKGSTEPDQ